MVDLDDLQSKLSDKTAVFMITNPNTLGLFDPNISKIAKMVHDAGALVYVDGANMNAIMSSPSTVPCSLQSPHPFCPQQASHFLS